MSDTPIFDALVRDLPVTSAAPLVVEQAIREEVEAGMPVLDLMLTWAAQWRESGGEVDA